MCTWIIVYNYTAQAAFCQRQKHTCPHTTVLYGMHKNTPVTRGVDSEQNVNMIAPQPVVDLQQIGNGLRFSHQLTVPGPRTVLGQGLSWVIISVAPCRVIKENSGALGSASKSSSRLDIMTR